MLIDHIGIVVSDYRKSKAFYLQALLPLGIELVAEVDGWAGLGKGERGEFWFGEDEDAEVQQPMHIALAASTRQAVDRFYEAAIAAGGKDNGKPGIRSLYHPHYYGAFVIDPDGHNIEAVCHEEKPV